MRKSIPWICIFYVGIVAGYYGMIHTTFESQDFPDYFNTPFHTTGIVTDDPDRGLEKTQVVVQPDSMQEKILIRLPVETDIAYGDEISFSGLLKKPESFVTDTDRNFNYPAYLAVKGIYGIMTVSDVVISNHHHGLRLFEYLFQIKKFFVATITKLFPLPESGLFAGIIIGEKSLLPKEVLGDFQIAGLTHMIVLSGYNITIVALFIMTACAWLGFGYRTRRWIALIVIPLFIIMTGIGASSFRAGIMSCLVFLLQIMTRPQHGFRIIVFTLTIMVIINPISLVYDPSLHLSFLAFIGLLYVAPITEKMFSKFPDTFGIRNLISETLAVQLFVLPYIIYMSGRISILTLFSNIITVPIVPILMGIGFSATILGMIIYPLGILVAYPVHWGLSYIIWVAHSVASIDSAMFVIPPIGAVFILIIYLIICGGLIYWHRNNK